MTADGIESRDAPCYRRRGLSCGHEDQRSQLSETGCIVREHLEGRQPIIADQKMQARGTALNDRRKASGLLSAIPAMLVWT